MFNIKVKLIPEDIETTFYMTLNDPMLMLK